MKVFGEAGGAYAEADRDRNDENNNDDEAAVVISCY